jgi:hypothetical protein
MADFPRYEPAGVRCSGVAQPGVTAFMEWAVRDFGRGAFNLGIYNCRTVRGSANRSLHGDGRAGDVGFPGVANANGTALLNTLGETLTRGEIVLLINTLADGLVRLLPQEALGN